jgi:S-adenosylmethionine decarboxylase
MVHGRHIKVVGYGVPALLGSVDRVRRFLEELVPALGMRPLGEPILHDVALDLSKMNVVEPFEDEGGVTGTVVLSTSHCAIHTWPARSFFILDVFSCRDFNASTVQDHLRQAFEVSTHRTTDVSAALEPPPR